MMLRLLLRVLLVPAVIGIGGAVWLHLRDAAPAPPAAPGAPSHHPAHPRRPAAGDQSPTADPAAITSTSPRPAAGPAGLASDLWNELNRGTRATADGEMAIIRELGDAIRHQVERLMTPARPHG